MLRAHSQFIKQEFNSGIEFKQCDKLEKYVVTIYHSRIPTHIFLACSLATRNFQNSTLLHFNTNSIYFDYFKWTNQNIPKFMMTLFVITYLLQTTHLILSFLFNLYHQQNVYLLSEFFIKIIK